MDYIASYDFGTSGVKAALVSRDGKIVAVKEKGYPLLKPRPLWVEQSPDDFWNSVCEVTHSVLDMANVDPQNIKGLNFSVQAVTLIPVDKDGNVLYNAISWLDGRAETQADEINKTVGAVVVRSQDASSRILWLKENMPDLYDNTKYFLDCDGFLQFKCTGIMAVPDDYDGILSLPKEVKEYYKACNCLIDDSKFPPMVEACREYGKLDKKGAGELGLCEGTPVFGGMIDVPSAAAGCACIKPGDAHIYFGSSGWLSVLTDRLYNTSEGTYQINSVVPGTFIYGGCSNCACTMQNWALDRFYSHEMKEMGGKFWAFLEKELASVPAGCDGLYASNWLFGEQFPIADPRARAMFFNIKENHTNAYFLKAALESVCFAMRGQIDTYYKDCGGSAFKRIGANGGGSLSGEWMQMLSDILGMEICVPENTRHSGAIGAALCVAIGLGWCTIESVNEFVSVDKIYKPNLANKAMYDEKYKNWFRMYESVKDIFHDINK